MTKDKQEKGQTNKKEKKTDILKDSETKRQAENKKKQKKKTERQKENKYLCTRSSQELIVLMN